MPRALDPREFFRVHAGFDEHPKINPLSDAAFRAIIEAYGLCKRTRNDGRIPLATWRKKWKPKPRAELVDAGLIDIEPDAAVVHGWLNWQPSVAELDAKRDARTEAGRKGGKRSGESRRNGNESPTKPEANASPNAQANANQTGQQTRTIDEQELERELERELENDLARSACAVPGHLGGERPVGDASATSEDPPPPKHHAEHPNVWAPDCAQCEAVIAARIAWLNARIAESRPAERCATHLGIARPPACGQCADARRAATQWDADHEKSLRADAAARRALASRCQLCDTAGWRIPPPELLDADPPVAKCNHDAGLIPAAWRALIAQLLADPTPEEAASA